MKRTWALALVLGLLLTTGAQTQQRTLAKDLILSPTFHRAAERVYGVDISGEVHSEVSQDSYRWFVKKLTENGSRWISSPTAYSSANEKAREWLMSQLTNLSNGRIETEIIGEYKSVVGRLPGYLNTGPALMVGGHYDSVPAGPGANDDGTGVAAALELARVMSQYDWPLDIYFGFWNAEEIGLLGSREVAQEFQSRGVDILIYYNIDMLLVVDSGAPSDELVLIVYNHDVEGGYHVTQFWADLTKMMSHNLGEGIIKPVPYLDFPLWPNSDHASFLTEDYERVLFAFESGFFTDDTDYHQPTDVWNNTAYNYEVATETVASIGASMAFAMSQQYGEKTVVEYTGSVSVGDSEEYYLVMSMPTSIEIDVAVNNEAAISLLDPDDLLVVSNSELGTAGILEATVDTSVSRMGLHRLIVDNTGNFEVAYTLRIEYNSDIDGNDVSDSEHLWFDTATMALDSDSDSLHDILEIIYGTDKNDPDTDEDTMTDGWEIENGLNPLSDDSSLDPDDDMLSNLQEFLQGTDPNLNDTDSDSMPDNWEVQNGLDPLSDDSSLDPDGDTMTNLQEYLSGTDPHEYNVPFTLVALGGVGVAAVLITGGLVFIWRRSR
ncbi:MAG: M20/M25/M40 family metallo-hydrolase [Candidatus Thorarchaeota archaeon]|nr:MAG: M20/M25/M40 family metallo-hydrolase [Candidatus Thorarchaeota archaeon]